MNAEEYDQWYETPRGQWIGQREVALILDELQPRPGESLLDVGCGTGFFTRSVAAAVDGRSTGVDINPDWVEFARQRDTGRSTYAVADAQKLPYGDASFDLVMSITAICFTQEEITSIREIVRVARRRFAIGLLNRHSLLWWQKGRHGGHGAYKGAHWHTVQEVKSIFHGLPVERICVQTAIQCPGGSLLARSIENVLPSSWPTGGFILVTGDVT